SHPVEPTPRRMLLRCLVILLRPPRLGYSVGALAETTFCDGRVHVPNRAPEPDSTRDELRLHVRVLAYHYPLQKPYRRAPHLHPGNNQRRPVRFADLQVLDVCEHD